MLISRINKLINKFNITLDTLIKGYSKNNLDEHTLIFLADNTRRFMSFTQLSVLNILFKVLQKLGDAKYKFNQDIIDTDKMIEIIFKQINNSLDEILSQKVNENRQKDIDGIVNNLIFIRKLISDISYMIFSILKYQSHVIDENEFRDKYRNFKNNMENNRRTFNKLY